MAATDKTALKALTGKEFDKLDALLQGVEGQVALKKDAEDTSIKDVIGHRAHWIDLFLGWYADGMAGKTVVFPAQPATNGTSLSDTTPICGADRQTSTGPALLPC